ncbi:MAG: BMP family ABC transporter substrate-binding protein [Acidimicrobiales bacterium]
MKLPTTQLTRLLALLLAFGLAAAACGGSDAEDGSDAGSSTDSSEEATDDSAADSTDDGGEDAAADSDACGAGATTVGFLYVGPKDDFGYNQAAYEAAVAMGESTGVEVLHAENVPETIEDAVPVMEDMIAQGATILFPTSYGHFQPAVEVAAAHPDVCVVHQGQLESSLDEPLDNLGTYFASVFEPVYLAGIAAGSVTESNTMGYIYAFPIPQTLQNINAFALGAQSVNPDAEVIAVSTADWCDPAKQAQAAQTLLDQGADVLTQHQDCTKTIIETAEAAGAYSVGYHYDASELAPEGWITGSDWAWTPLYVDIVETMIAGEFVASPYNGDYRIGYQDADAPFVAFEPSEFGAVVDDDTKAAVADALASLTADEDGDGVGDFNIFAGPISDRDGEVRIPDGTAPTYTELDELMGFASWFVAGVEGSLE